MEKPAQFWYFFTRRTGRRPAVIATPAVRNVAFNRTKYGRSLLIDVAWVHDMPTFILNAPHRLDFFDIILITRGRGTFALDGIRHDIRSGRVFFTLPGQVRSWECERLDGLCLFFVEGFVREFLQDAAFLDKLPFFHTSPEQASLQLSPGPTRLVRARLTAMRNELAHFHRDSEDLLRAQLHETLLLLARDYATAYDVPRVRAMHPAVAHFGTLVERHLSERHRVDAYAADLGVSPGHLSVLCSQYAGMTAKRYIDNALMLRARRLLLYTDESAAQIGAALGFDDPSYFARFFRREAGDTPSAFRSGNRAHGKSDDTK
jgi:AraC-like DNA-binding protein